MVEILLADEQGRIIVQPDGSGIVVGSHDAGGPAAPRYTVADFTAALLALLPSGRVWPREAGATLPAVAAGLAASFARLADRAAALLQDSPTGFLAERLEEWEATTGLPDPCAGGYQDILARNRAVLARIPGQGGQSVPYVVRLAALLGYTVTVQEFRPSYCDDSCSMPLRGEAWAYRWRVVVAPQPDEAWDPVAHAWFAPVLECAIRRMAPAHTEVAVVFTAAAIGTFMLDRDVLTP